MPQRPTGTVTFLFTDVEGSTRLWEEHPDAMRDALAQHDSILEERINGAGGFIHSTAGDAYSAAFSDPLDAITAAIDAQKGLAGADWPFAERLKVRMAVHTGVAHERGDDYYGPALNRCARILSAAHGGQVVTSRGTEELVRHRLHPGVSLKDLGEHQLKDLGYPEQIFQIVAPGLDTDFADLRSLDPSKNNLPLQLTSFVGREDELRDVKKRLLDTRLLTLTGVGGSGKTRLSLQAAAESAEDFRDGVWLVELAAVSDPDKLPAWVAESLRINKGQSGVGAASTPSGAVPVIEQIADYLRKRQALLILDNCEHLIAASADFATYLLRSCPDIKILATSREGLGISGETLWQVPSLEMPNRYDVEELGGSGADALRLFQDRAAAVNPNFEINSETYPYVLKICRRLDGMPLAIELAAARAKSLDVARIADRLDDRFRLLTGGSRTALPRQQTLAAAVEWSYELLDEAERVFFNRLAAFRGGFTLEAAESVCSGGIVDEFDIVDHLSSLVDKSMVAWDSGSGDRYRLLETLRQYALGKLKDSGEADEVRTRHAQHFLALAEKAAPHLRGPEQVDWMERLEAEHENFRAAMAFTDEHDMTELTARMAAALHWFWGVRRHYEELGEWLGPLLGREQIGHESTLLELMMGYAWYLVWTDQFETLKAHIVDTQGMARRLGKIARLAEAYLIESWMISNEGRYGEAEAIAERALETARAAGDDWAIGWAAYGRGWIDRMRADVEAARPYFDLAVTKMRKVGDTLGLAWASGVGGILARYSLDYEAARQLHEESLEQARRLGDKGLEAFGNATIGIIDRLEGKYEDSIARHKKTFELEQDIGALGTEVAENLYLMAESQLDAGLRDDARKSLQGAIERLDANRTDPTVLAAVHELFAREMLRLGQTDRAARLLGWASAVRKETGRAVPPPDRPEREEAERQITEQVEDMEGLMAEGAAWDYERSLSEARKALELL